MDLLKRFVFGFAAVLITFQSSFAFARDYSISEFEELSRDLNTRVEIRALALSLTNDLRSLELLEQKMGRQLLEANRQITIIKTMLEKSGDMKSISKETVFSDASFLLYGCYLQRIVGSSARFAESSAPVQSGLCSTMDYLVVGLVGTVAMLSSQNARNLATDILKSEREARIYPKSAWLFRASFAVMALTALVQNTLSYVYSEDINYRKQIDSMDDALLTAEVQRVFKSGDFASRELAAIELAKELVAENMKKKQSAPSPGKST